MLKITIVAGGTVCSNFSIWSVSVPCTRGLIISINNKSYISGFTISALYKCYSLRCPRYLRWHTLLPGVLWPQLFLWLPTVSCCRWCCPLPLSPLSAMGIRWQTSLHIPNSSPIRLVSKATGLLSSHCQASTNTSLSLTPMSVATCHTGQECCCLTPYHHTLILCRPAAKQCNNINTVSHVQISH